MKPNTSLLHSVWKNSGVMTQKDVEFEKLRLDELIASIFSNGPFYFYVVDFFDKSIKYMSPHIQEVHGLDPAKATFQDILEQIHPDDMPFVAKAETAAIELIYNRLGGIDIANIHKYKVSYCFRMKVADGSYQLFNHQALILNADENGNCSKSLNIHTNISHLTNVNNYCVSAIGMFGEPSYLQLPIDENGMPAQASQSLFSKREIEVIRLMADGLTNAAIAEKLNIAVNTVKNHRKNIFQKANCKNSGQLITKCITEGLI